MRIAARLSNNFSQHKVEVETEGRTQSIPIARNSVGRGSSINDGELLFVALATCFCNDLYREAAKRGVEVQDVQVEVTGTFGNPGETTDELSVTASRYRPMRRKPRLMILFAQRTHSQRFKIRLALDALSGWSSYESGDKQPGYSSRPQTGGTENLAHRNLRASAARTSDIAHKTLARR
jgi:hypothetical protein